MIHVTSHTDFLEKAGGKAKSFLLLYKPGSEQSLCAYQNLEKAMEGQIDSPFFIADVTLVRDIHPRYGITSVPSLLVFGNNDLASVIKGCQESTFYKALAENAIFQSKNQSEGKTAKSVTVYSTPTCSWCNTLKTWLRKNSIPYTDVDVSRNSGAADELVRRSGQQGVPQTDINGRIVVGFDQKRLKELLEIP